MRAEEAGAAGDEGGGHGRTLPCARDEREGTRRAAAALRVTCVFPAQLAFVGLGLAFVAFRVGSFNGIPSRVTDTPGYERTAALPIWSLDFYTAERGFTLPLLYKLLPGDHARIDAQLAFAIVAWLVFAAIAAAGARSTPVRLAIFAVVLGFALTSEIVLWDTLLLSESVSLSLLALVLAAWLLVVRRPTCGRVAAVLVVSLLWAFARDTNAYEVLLAGVLSGAALVRPGARGAKLGLALGCVAIFAVNTASADAGKRWLQPMVDVVAHRVLPDPSLRAHFVGRGLDPTTDWIGNGWVERNGRRVYAGYLLSHPAYVFTAPFRGRQTALYSTARNSEALLDPSMGPYDDNASHRPLPAPTALRAALFPRGIPAAIVLLAVAVAAAGGVALRLGATRSWLVPAVALVSVYPQYLIAWHMSGVEVDRHALTPALLLRLGSFLLVLHAVDRALSRSRIVPRELSDDLLPAQV